MISKMTNVLVCFAQWNKFYLVEIHNISDSWGENVYMCECVDMSIDISAIHLFLAMYVFYSKQTV